MGTSNQRRCERCGHQYPAAPFRPVCGDCTLELETAAERDRQDRVRATLIFIGHIQPRDHHGWLT